MLKKWLKNRRRTSEDMLEELRRKGAKIGSDVVVYAPNHTIIDSTCAYLLSIGDHVRITSDVKILTHDYSWSVLKSYEPDQAEPGAILGAQAPVNIGSYVFIGMNAIITPGVSIGDHVIIGAGSVVTKDCESNAVYAGNPARKIAELESFYQKRKALQFEEAKNMALHYRERFHKDPPQEIFNEYFMLFATREQAEAVPAFRLQMTRMGNFEETAVYMDKHTPMFDGYEAFLKACFEETK